MDIEIGRIEALFRYPVKSMRGESIDAAALGLHGLDGDRRLALRRLDDPGDFPVLTASSFSDLVLYTPRGDHVRTPEGEDLPTFGDALAADVARRCGARVEMMRWKHGVFDDAAISVITTDTVAEICRGGGVPADARRFRPNVVVRSTRAVPFEEDAWVGGVLRFGEGDDAPAVTITARDVRCAMVNIDPDDGRRNAEVMKTVVRANDNNAGVYATVTRTGRVFVGQALLLRR
jgi:uncharacterized protein YcbX